MSAVAGDGNTVPLLITIAGILLGGGGLTGILAARAQRQNYITTGYKSLTDASAKEAADERAARQRAEYSRDRWRDYAYALRDELAGHGIAPTSRAPTDHPSEAT